jgi:hypothetical protein
MRSGLSPPMLSVVITILSTCKWSMCIDKVILLTRIVKPNSVSLRVRLAASSEALPAGVG